MGFTPGTVMMKTPGYSFSLILKDETERNDTLPQEDDYVSPILRGALRTNINPLLVITTALHLPGAILLPV